MSHPSRYFADDKDIYDLLASNPKRMGVTALRKFLVRRGLFVSANSTRTELVELVSTLNLGFRDLQDLLAMVESSSPRAPRTTTEFVNVGLDDFQAAATAIKSARAVRRSEEHKITVTADGALRILVHYSTLEASRTRLRQKVEHEALIEVERVSPETVRVRFPDGEFAQQLVEDILLAATSSAAITRDAIHLVGGTAHDKSHFFETLMTRTAGFVLVSVSRVRFRLGVDVSDAQLDGESDELPGEPEEGSDVRVLRIQLDGQGVFQTGEFHSLKAKGFFIVGAVWRAREANATSLDVELEAQFEVGEVCPPLTYKLRGVFRRDEEERRTRARPTSDERNRVLRAVENAAFNAKEEFDAAVNALPDELQEPGAPAANSPAVEHRGEA